MRGSDLVDIAGELFSKSLRPIVVLAIGAFFAFTDWGHQLVTWYVFDKAAGILETWLPAFHNLTATAGG